MANELPEIADTISWTRKLELVEFEKTAGYFCIEDLPGASAAERVQVDKIMVAKRANWAGVARKLLDA